MSINKIDPNENVLAVLGLATVGKTVFTSLIDYVVVGRKDDFRVREYDVIEGEDFLRVVLGGLTQGNWPAGTVTQAGDVVRTTLIFSGRFGAKKVQLHVRDIDGKDVDRLRQSQNPLHFLLTDQQGQLAFISYARAYAFVVDPTRNLFDMDFQYMSLLNRVSEARTGKRDGKIDGPVSVVVTKWDLLSPEDAKLTASRFVRERMPRFSLALANRVKHNSEIPFFYSKIKTVKTTDGNTKPDVSGGRLQVEGVSDFIDWVREKL